MSGRVMRPCATPNCPTLVSKGHCDTHARARQKRTRRKPADQQAFYNSTAWKKARARVRYEEPLCALCKRRRSTNVDHIDGDYTNNERSNLRALCDECERTRTGRQHARQARGGETEIREGKAAPARSPFSHGREIHSGFV